jgi:NAD(P)-dependent dehydrogenase (short-subunit alcohol dehydrogenase family)
MATLAGHHALVTGGGSGIGAAIALTLAQAGAAVTICGRRRERLAAIAAQQAGLYAEPADVTDRDAVLDLYKQAEKARGPFGIVIANAGGAQSAAAEKVSPQLWNDTLNVNLSGAFFSVQPALAGMRERGFGRIVFIASTAGLKGAAYVVPYVAAKHGVIGLMRALAAETAKHGITVNAVCPGYTETPMLERAVERIAATTKRDAAEARAALAAKNPQGRFITPAEVAGAVLWLCGEASAGITGQAIAISGGETW